MGLNDIYQGEFEDNNDNPDKEHTPPKTSVKDYAVYDNGYHYYRYAFQNAADIPSKPSPLVSRLRYNDTDCDTRDWNAEFQGIVEGELHYSCLNLHHVLM